jgi:hypothetical protein
MDSQQTFANHVKDPGSQSKLAQYGWLEPNCISYSFNTAGFRDDEFTGEPAGLALGCSFTQGIGVDMPNTWARQLSNLTGQRIWNLGVGGGASDTMFRLAEYWLEHLNIKFVTMLVPNVERVEIWDNGRPHILMHNTDNMQNLVEYKKVYWSNNINGEINQRKNLLAIQQLCTQKQIPICWMFKDDIDPVDLGRDLAHCGRKSTAIIAEKMYEMIKEKL